MPSPIQMHGQRRFYKRKDGAYILKKGSYKKVGSDRYGQYPHYSKRNLKQDRARRARKNPSKRRNYPHAYD